MIERIPTSAESKDFQNIGQGRKLSEEDLFAYNLSKAEAEAHKKGLPFCAIAAKDDWKNSRQEQITTSIRKRGYVSKNPVVNIDFSKYCDLKNFTMDENPNGKEFKYTGETHDAQLSKRHDKDVYLKFKVFRFTGYENYKYRVFEPSMGKWDVKEVSSVQQQKN